MYSTNLKDNRYIVKSLVVSRYVTSDEFIVDTGAKFTCCSFWTVDDTLREAQFDKEECRYIGGLVKGTMVKFYKYQLKQFTIGTIDMGTQDIWITFDNRVTDTVLGMDILKQVIMIANPYNHRLYFCKDVEDYNNNFELAVG